MTNLGLFFIGEFFFDDCGHLLYAGLDFIDRRLGDSELCNDIVQRHLVFDVCTVNCSGLRGHRRLCEYMFDGALMTCQPPLHVYLFGHVRRKWPKKDVGFTV